MKIASFNINGVKARLPALLDWLRDTSPDVVCLQEIKSVDETFPREPIEDAGYNLVTHGQKGFNGVAILSRRPIEDVIRGLPGDATDEQARWIEATISGDGAAVRICGLYLPNGNPAPGPKYDYKLAWMERMRHRAAELIASEDIAVLAGDYNVIPQPIDAAKPDAWVDDALFLPQTRAAYRRIVNQGWTEAWRDRAPEGDSSYTFWDYQAGAWQRNNGIRIDHLLLSPQAADRLEAVGIDAHVRGGEKPSDHVPIWAQLRL
ncbi:MAG: exodeoxyribonuclease-3 [Paracoccaceae bacterium]|jgi:exodeoxyribonuclease-3